MSRRNDTRPEHEKLADAIRKIEDELHDAPVVRLDAIRKAHKGMAMDRRRMRLLAARDGGAA